MQNIIFCISSSIIVKYNSTTNYDLLIRSCAFLFVITELKGAGKDSAPISGDKGASEPQSLI